MAETTNRDWLQKEKFTVAFSSGFFGFYAHSGFLAALLEHECIPGKVTGASAGAIVASMHASGLSSMELKENLFALRRQDFWDPALGFGLLKGKKMEEKLAEFLPRNFSELKTPLAVSTFDLLAMRTHVLEKNSDVITAVHASCALPGLFQPVKVDGQILIDGGVADDLALQSVEKDERVLSHYLQKSRRPNRFERWQMRHLDGRRGQAKILTLSERVFVGPHRLETGPEAYKQAYEHTKSWLNEGF